MLSHPLTTFEVQKYYQHEFRFNGVSSNNLPKIKDGVHVINLDEYKSIGTHWVALYVKASHNEIYSDSFGVTHILKEIKKLIGNKNITSIYRIQAFDSIM